MNTGNSTSVQPVGMNDENQLKVEAEITVSDLDIRDLNEAQDTVRVVQVSGALWSVVNTPIEVRGNRKTAYASVTNITETTLLTGTAGKYHDLIYVMGANSSNAAVSVDIRDVAAGSVLQTINIPANSTAGAALPTPLPQSETGNNWTIKNSSSDDSTTTIKVSALFQIV